MWHPSSLRVACPILFGLFAVIAFSALSAPPAQAEIYPNPYHARAQVEVYYPGWAWRGAKANVEIRSGAVGQTDAENLGWVLQALWLADVTDYTDKWLEVGVIRHIWYPFNDQLVTRFYWFCKNSNGEHWHVIRWAVLNPNDYIGTQVKFQIANVQGSNNWTVTIDNQYANDEDNDHTGNPGYSTNDWYAVGVESSASSGRYATKSDHCEVTQIMRNYDWTLWDYAQVQYALDPYVYDPNGTGGDPSAHGNWTTRVQSMWDYRNNPN